MILRPAGTASSKWSIQVEMGLGGTGKKYNSYEAIQVRALRQRWIVHLPTMHTYTWAHAHFFPLCLSLHSKVFMTWCIIPHSIGNYHGVKFLLVTRQHYMKL
jgi:hypothetical protein